jgi:MFS family permease
VSAHAFIRGCLRTGGLIAIAAAVGIGRFIYTPILPPMAEGLHLTKGEAGLIASANFLGYLAGALAAASPRLPGRTSRLVARRSGRERGHDRRHGLARRHGGLLGAPLRWRSGQRLRAGAGLGAGPGTAQCGRPRRPFRGALLGRGHGIAVSPC